MNDDFIAIIVCEDKNNKIKYINKEFKNGKGFYPKNCQEDINELINSLGYDEDFDIYELNPIDVCEIIDTNGNTLWNEK